MFKNTFQSGFLSILYSIGSKPLQIWDKKVNISVNIWNSLPNYVLLRRTIEKASLCVAFQLSRNLK